MSEIIKFTGHNIFPKDFNLKLHSETDKLYIVEWPSGYRMSVDKNDRFCKKVKK